MDHLLETELDLALERDQVFEFFSHAQNLELITPPELRFTIVSPEPILMRRGTTIDYRLKLYGIPFGWTTRIAEWEPPESFVDEQLRGPYAKWIHTHTFHEHNGATTIRDRVIYRLPLRPVGDIAHRLVRRQLERIFEFRRRAVADALVGSGVGSP